MDGKGSILGVVLLSHCKKRNRLFQYYTEYIECWSGISDSILKENELCSNKTWLQKEKVIKWIKMKTRGPLAIMATWISETLHFSEGLFSSPLIHVIISVSSLPPSPMSRLWPFPTTFIWKASLSSDTGINYSFSSKIQINLNEFI